MPKDIKSEEEFTQLVAGDKLTIVDFYASWCGACKTFMPKYEELEKQYSNVQFLKVDVDELEEIAGDMGVNGLPYIVLMKGGKKVEDLSKVSEKAVIEKLEKLGGSGGAVPAAAPASDSAPAPSKAPVTKVKVPEFDGVDFFQLEDPKSKNILSFRVDGDKISYDVNGEPRPSFKQAVSDGGFKLLFKDINKGATLPAHNVHINLACLKAMLKKVGGEAIDFPTEISL
eukprot:TRINITY_DN30261_c0_g1_i1.p1 TRINITY_DN30261_c0_g1~~TRINITY_DN30261_c0_g1_i1.p1  ORF type:complete len:228 (+),score=70.26 TRINITY_DN30261_c0_g1_i1:68-751(+)